MMQQLRFWIAHHLHDHTKLCWYSLVAWALGWRGLRGEWKRCDLCKGDGYTFCGRDREEKA